jgi:hypothetical protein
MANLQHLELKLRIDEHALDIALREHPDLFYQVASELALAISNRDEAKQDLDEVEAEVDMELRKDAATSGEKTTETQIQSNKKLDKRVKSANDILLEQRYNAAKWTALKEAYESRSYALSKLVDLYLANYFSSTEDKKTGAATLRDVQSRHVKEELASRRKRVSP